MMQNGKGALDVDGMKFGNKYLMTKDAPNTLYLEYGSITVDPVTLHYKCVCYQKHSS